MTAAIPAARRACDRANAARALDLRSRSLAAADQADLAASEGTATRAERLATTGRPAFDREPFGREHP